VSGAFAAAAAPVVEPAPVALVDVRIDSTPRGATVTLVDRGKTQLVGNTPISVAFDPSREYDLVFSYPNKPTKIEHLNASATHKVLVALEPEAVAAPVAVAPPPAPVAHKRRAASSRRPSRPASAASDASDDVAVQDDAPEPAAAPAQLGEGTLMVSTKPPCEIVIDGRATGLTTPQKRITLTAGAHKLTLINGERGIKKTVSVQIDPDEPKKVIEDFLE
ncbi:MAG TPA: hypothetical protein VFP84_39690, partial [Kofleriaceae bacterium]|nr:hypothetical protein [Kofleriaceae bacterium]